MLIFSPITNCLIALIVVGIVYLRWFFQYWKRRGVVTPTVIIPFGNSQDVFFGNGTLGEVYRNYYNMFKQQDLRYGGTYFLTRKVFVPIDPALIKSIIQIDFDNFMNHATYVNEERDPLAGHLFSLKDAKWRNLRVKLTPTFTSGKMKMMFETLANCAKDLEESIGKAAVNKSPIDVKNLLACFSTDIIVSCAFGIESNCIKNPDSDFRTFGKKVFGISTKQLFYAFLQFMLSDNMLELIKFKFSQDDVEEFFMNVVKNTVHYRETNNICRKDFMHLLIQLKNLGTVSDDEKIFGNGVKEAALSMNEIAAQAFVFFVAGFETSSTLMTFALYELALNTQIQTKLRNEINEVLKKFDGKLTYDAMIEMQYLEQVIKETLRKYPPVPILNRKCSKDYRVPDTNLIIEKDTLVFIPTLGLHYDHEYYPNPTVFDPDRFNEENNQSRPAFTWLPFGEGPRHCIGLRFGKMQSKVGLITFLKNYEITINRKTTVPVVLDKQSFFTSALGGIYLNAKKIAS